MILGIDIAADNVAVILAKADGTTELALRTALARDSDATTVWTVAMQTAREALQRAMTVVDQVQSVALAFPGPVNDEGVVGKSAKAAGWQGFDLVRGACEHLGVASALAASRVQCEAHAEWHLGALRPTAGQPAGDWVYVHLGSTIEGAAGVRGHQLTGAAGAALDIGAICIERGGVLCSSGRRGCLDGYCGSDAFLGRAAAYGLTLRSVAEVWDSGSSNFAARSLCDDYVQRLAQGLGTVLVLLNPANMVLGGPLIVAPGAKLIDPLRVALRDYCQPAHLEPLRLETSRLGHDAAVMGAVAMAWAALNAGPATAA